MKKVLIGLGIVIAALVILGLALPKDFTLEREVIINKPKDAVFAYTKMLKNGNDWSPWSKRDPNIVIEYRGEDGTVGFVSSWRGNKDVGAGEQEIKAVVEGERIDTELRFKEPMEDTSRAYLITEAVGDQQTKVRWGMAGPRKFPMNLICFFLGVDKMIAKDFEDGLASLKSILEQQP